MPDADWLIENLIHWYGKHVPKSVFDDYLTTYIELGKPDFAPMLIYKWVVRQSESESFRSRASELGIVVE